MENKENKIRLDVFLVQKGLVLSRERAKNLISEKKVKVDGKIISKLSFQVDENSKIELLDLDIPWVSRAGLKLAKAIEFWKINIQDKICLDIGSSTGGFTQVLLKNEAQKVFALDVGTNQLVQSLRENSKVIVMENKNIREARKDWFETDFDFICVDVSFISLEYVLPKIKEFFKKGGEAILLLKPQFEVGKENLDKGIVKDEKLYQQVIEKLKNNLEKNNLKFIDFIDSPILGKEGNKEFLIYIKN